MKRARQSTDKLAEHQQYKGAGPSLAGSGQPSLQVPRHSTTKRRRAKKCTREGCNKGVRSRGLCKGHGGGRRCSVPDCKNSDQGGGVCIKHGGGRRCSVEHCKNSAQSRGLCKSHGGGRRCQMPGCTRSSQGAGRCRAHGGGKRCKVDGCNKGEQREGYCAAHRAVKHRGMVIDTQQRDESLEQTRNMLALGHKDRVVSPISSFLHSLQNGGEMACSPTTADFGSSLLHNLSEGLASDGAVSTPIISGSGPDDLQHRIAPSGPGGVYVVPSLDNQVRSALLGGAPGSSAASLAVATSAAEEVHKRNAPLFTGRCDLSFEDFVGNRGDFLGGGNMILGNDLFSAPHESFAGFRSSHTIFPLGASQQLEALHAATLLRQRGDGEPTIQLHDNEF